MTISLGVVLCVAYIVGLLSTGIPIAPLQFGIFLLPVSGLSLFALTLVFALTAPRRWKLGISVRIWCGLAAVSLLATLYITLRSPHPSAHDINTYVERAQAIAPVHIVSGRVIDEPRLNRGLKGRFRVAVNRLEVEDAEGNITFQIAAQGRLYVTAPLLQTTGLHIGQTLTAKGQLYLPQAAKNPHGFDFQAYLAKQHTFTGFVAEELHFSELSHWGLWRVRQRLVRTQVQALGSPLGQLVSAMALGRKAVDLPFDIQDLFSQVGLAHTIAASGFHVSLLLGTVLAGLQSRSGKLQLIIGLIVLGGYITLTGLQASVVRAGLMGVAALIGLATERKVKPVGALLLAVTLMLLVNPLWIWDIGFQLSAAATFGLIVMVPVLTRALDWLPVTLSGLVAVPTAATLWTVPLMLYHFNTISGLSIALNTIATPLVTVVSLGGISSSALALVSPPLARLIAGLLQYPTQGLLWLAHTGSQLPGSAIAIGQISIWQLIGLYTFLLGGIGSGHSTRLRKLWPLGFLGLLLLPMGWGLLTQHQITVLAAGDELVWIMQDHGHTTLVNSGSEKTAFYTVNPFLQQAGIHQIETAIAPPLAKDYPAGWQSLLRSVPSLTLYGNSETSPVPDFTDNYQQLKVGQSTSLKHLTVQTLGTENPILRLTTSEQTWLLLPALSLTLQDHLAKAGSILQSQVLVWSGDELSDALLNTVDPEVAICYGRTLSESIERDLQQSQVQVYSTAREGAITWRYPTGFQGYLDVKHRNSKPWN